MTFPHMTSIRIIPPEYKLLRYHRNNPFKKDIFDNLISIFETLNISIDWKNETRKADIYVNIKESKNY